MRKPGEAPRLQVSVGFTWDEDSAMDMPVLDQKEESSESEEEEDKQSKVPCNCVVCTGDRKQWL